MKSQSVKHAGFRSTAIASALTLAATMALAATPVPLAGSGGGGGGGGGGEEIAPNNLSFPAIQMETAAASAAFAPAVPPVLELGKNFSFACAKVDDSGDRVLNNTSCVNSTGTEYFSAAQCVDPGYPCAGYPVERIYWQKTTDNR